MFCGKHDTEGVTACSTRECGALYKHPSVSPALTQGILERDARDSSRDVAPLQPAADAVAPLQPAADAVIIDTSHLDADAVLAEAMRWVAIKLPGLAQQP